MNEGTAGEHILHADLDSFYASVEQRDDRALRGRPVIVGGGVVLAASYEARAFGVRSAMGGRQARDLCPHAVVVPPRFAAYSAASRAIIAIFEQAAPPITVGIARTKFLAKVASGIAKPDGLRLVPTEGELHFLHPLPVQKLWGVGAKTAVKLAERGITTVGDVALLDERSLVAMLGRNSGRHLHALAHNRDPRPVQAGRRRRSIGAQRALGRRAMSPADIDATLLGLVERVAGRLRSAGRLCRTVVLRLRFADFTRATRSHTLARPTADTGAFVAALRALLAVATPRIERDGLTLLGVTLTNLDRVDAVQPELPFATVEARILDAAVDGIRDRFGRGSITRGVLLGRDAGPNVPLLPD